ncbi:MAG: hypothetical protein ACSW8F_01180 [bacterium]
MNNGESVREAFKSFLSTVAITLAFFLLFLVVFFLSFLLSQQEPLKADENEELYIVLQEDETVETSREKSESSVVEAPPVEMEGLNTRVISPVAPVGEVEWTE